MSTEIPLEKIVVAENIRNVKDVQIMANSLAENGQVVPVQVFALDNGNYQLVVGHIRLAAAKSLGWETIKAVVEPAPANDVETMVVQYVENEHRQGSSYLEKCQVYKALKDRGLSQKEIAKKFGVSDVDVSLALSTLRAHLVLQQAVQDGKLKPSALEPMLSLPMEDQETLAAAAIQAKTVRAISKLVRAHKIATANENGNATVNNEEIDPNEELINGVLDDTLKTLSSLMGLPGSDKLKPVISAINKVLGE